MLARMQVDHEIDQGAFQLRTGAGEADEPTAAQFRCASQIEKFQLLA